MDRPTTNGGLIYLTKVHPHRITRKEQEIDPFVVDALSEVLGHSPLEIWSRHTRSFYSLEGHYANLWKFDKTPVYQAPKLPRLDEAIQRTRQAFALTSPVTAYG